MNRLTSNNPFEVNMHKLALNQVYIADGCAWYIKAPDEECSVCDLIRNAAETLNVELPILSDEGLSSLLADWLQYGEEEPEGVLAILCRALWAMAELRDRLKQYEDTGLEPEEVADVKLVLMGRELAKITDFDGVSIPRMCELAQAEKEGRLVVLPCKREDILWTFCTYPKAEVYSFSVRDLSTLNGRTMLNTDRLSVIPASDVGKAVFLTRAEAEAELERRIGGTR